MSKTRGERIFEQISVNLETGEISYPAPEGFVLDMERVYSTARTFAPFAPSLEAAVKQAIHGQIIAFNGQQQLLAGLRR